MTLLRTLARRAAFDAAGDLKKAWPAFYWLAMAAEADGRVNFHDEFPITAETFPAVFGVACDAMARAHDDTELAAALLRQRLDRRENPTIVFELENERRMKLWPFLMDLVREECTAVPHATSSD